MGTKCPNIDSCGRMLVGGGGAGDKGVIKHILPCPNFIPLGRKCEDFSARGPFDSLIFSISLLIPEIFVYLVGVGGESIFFVL